MIGSRRYFSSSEAIVAALMLSCALCAAPARAVETIDYGPVIALTCKVPTNFVGWNDIAPRVDEQDKAFEWVAVDPDRIFYFSASSLGLIVNEQSARTRVHDSFKNQNNRDVAPDDIDVVNLVTSIQGGITDKLIENLRAFDAQGDEMKQPDASQTRPWLTDAYVLRCKRKKTSDASADIIAEKKSPITWAIRGEAAELPITGDDRKTTGAAKVSLVRERSFQDDGSRKQVTDISVKGVFGLGLENTKRSSLFLYGGYELKRSRSKPVVLPTPPAQIGDDDTNIVKIGAFGASYFDLDADVNTRNTAITLSLDTAYLFDLNKNSERFRASVSASPYFHEGIPSLCGFQRYRKTFIRGILGKCTIDALFQVNHITRKGSFVPTATDDFVLVGGRFGYELELLSNLDGGVFAKGGFEYQAALSGNVPDIRRHTLELKYRHWFDDRFAFDWGIDLVDGINPDSFADENRLSLSVGFVF
jgi:hypothetical protein